MTAARGRVVAALVPAAALLAVATPPSWAAWSGRSWLLSPSASAVARLGPVWAGDDGRGLAAVQTGDPATGVADWRLFRQRADGAWSDEEPLGVPAGLTPMAVGEDGTLVAAGIVATPAGPEIAASRRRNGSWEAPRALSAPLGATAPALAVVAGPDGAAAVSWLAAGVGHVSVVDDRLVTVAAPATGTPLVRLAESGAALALWTRGVRGGEALAYSVRPARSGWRTPAWAPVARPLPAGALSFDADVSATGQAVLAWTAGPAAGNRIWSSRWIGLRDRWTAPVDVAGATVAGARVEAVRTTLAGDALAVWSTPTRTETATLPAAVIGWNRDGIVPAAPGRGRADRAPVQVVVRRLGASAIGWGLHDGLAASVRGVGPGAWPPADAHTAVIGPLGVRFGAGPAGGLVASWAVTSGVASGRVGIAMRPGGDQPTPSGLRVTSGRAGPVAHVALTGAGTVALEARTARTGVLVAATLVNLPAGTTALPLPGEIRARLSRGVRYVLRIRTDSTGAAPASAAFTPRR